MIKARLRNSARNSLPLPVSLCPLQEVLTSRHCELTSWRYWTWQYPYVTVSLIQVGPVNTLCGGVDVVVWMWGCGCGVVDVGVVVLGNVLGVM